MNRSRRTSVRPIEQTILMPGIVEDDRWQAGVQIDWLAIAAAAFFILLAWQLFFKQAGTPDKFSNPENAPHIEPLNLGGSENAERMFGGGSDQVSQGEDGPDPAAIHYPYDDFWISQGPHGAAYGHMAVDLVAGKGSPIKSPLSGVVVDTYLDQYGNTTMILENARYRVTLMHGDYSVAIGQEINLGQVIGRESNKGYTTDIYGNPCWEGDCGFHTHLNVFDKTIGQNVNPLDVLAR